MLMCFLPYYVGKTFSKKNDFFLFVDYRKSERQLWFKNVLIFIMKTVMNGCFVHNDMKISFHIFRLRKSCSSIFEPFVALIGRINHCSKHDSNIQFEEFLTYKYFIVRGKLKPKYTNLHGFPIFDSMIDIIIFKTHINLFSMNTEFEF